MNGDFTYRLSLQIPSVGTSGPPSIGAAFPAEDFLPQQDYESTERTEREEEAEDLADALATKLLYENSGLKGFTPYREYREERRRT